MANQQQLALLKRSIDDWNDWRIKNPNVELDLSKTDLANANLYKAHLNFANLSATNLEQAKLFYTNFFGANLSSANLAQANLNSANLEHANLNAANLKNANLFYTKLKSAKLFYTKLENANLKNAKLNSAYLFYAQLNSANLTGADLSQANLNFANLEHANLHSAMVRAANFENANLNFAILDHANLAGADLRSIQALGTSFKGANLTGVCIEGWQINSKTNFEDVICDYVYLKWDRQKKCPGERYPTGSDQNFSPGEFTTLFQITRQTVNLIFPGGINWQAFLNAYQQLQSDHDHGELEVYSLEKSPDGSLVICLEVPENIKKTDFESQFFKHYELELNQIEVYYRQELQLTEHEISAYRQQNANLNEAIQFLATRPISINAKARADSV